MTVIATAGGMFDPTDRHHYVYATNPEMCLRTWEQIGEPEGFFVLVAVNDLGTPSSRAAFERLLAAGCKVLLDSGVFWLTNRHKRLTGITMDEALALAPQDIDGFDRLFDLYVELATSYGDRLWGYIELDQGGMVNKRNIRARLHDLGLSPIPVYHPLVDGWDYFDELAEGYDRLCFGNVVQADAPTRTRLLATAWERHRAYPDLWVHLLGYTPDHKLLAFPGAADSCDSSSWLTAMRWSKSWREKAMCRSIAGGMDPEMVYSLGDKDQREKQLGIVVSQFQAMELTWRDWPDRLAVPFLPDLLPQEPHR